ncbi:hypothetical protein [Cochlodiniinecator piscidefendens]|uniref:hypothetical protein n=1 Tax=Cochlodiniinecator piscidefendens TaxID=2715756 RepID=UPI00140BC616|nr:hypothetical protein [Cochlodiniinecator piscidefendens]
MAKLKIAIDNDIDYLVLSAEAAAFGYSAEVKLKVKRTGTTGAVSTLPAPDVFDLPSDQHEEIHVVPEDGGEE